MKRRVMYICILYVQMNIYIFFILHAFVEWPYTPSKFKVFCFFSIFFRFFTSDFFHVGFRDSYSRRRDQHSARRHQTVVIGSTDTGCTSPQMPNFDHPKKYKCDHWFYIETNIMICLFVRNKITNKIWGEKLVNLHFICFYQGKIIFL